MPAPNRSGGRRGGSYSRQRGPNQRGDGGRASGGRRSQPAGRGGQGGGRGGGRSGGGGRGGGGNDQMPLYLGLGAGAVLLIGVLVFLLASGGGDDPTPVVANPNPVPQPTRPATADGPAPEVMHPFSDRDKRRICELIENLDGDYDRAKELKDEGFRQHDGQNYDEAQAAWKEAFDLLTAMNEGVNDLELQFGEGIWERIERFLPTQDRTLSRWGRLRSDISKQLNTSR